MTTSPAKRFTVLMPVHRPPDLLPAALDSALAQEEGDFELFVVCDGAPAETAARAEQYAATDPRVRVFDFPKGRRHGEAHRHVVLQEALGRYVAHLADDDLWFPDYLTELGQLLDEVDFGNLLQVDLEADRTLVVHCGDLAEEAVRRRMLTTSWNFFGPSFAGYRLDAYRRLPTGWSPAPRGIWSDLYMWRKLLAAPGLAFGTRFAVAGVKLSASTRDDRLDDRVRETAELRAYFASADNRRDFRARAFAQLYEELTRTPHPPGSAPVGRTSQHDGFRRDLQQAWNARTGLFTARLRAWGAGLFRPRGR